MNTKNYIDILRCPHCTREDKGVLAEVKSEWLGCSDCGRQYPIVEGIPVMLPEEGDKWLGVATDDLPKIEEHDRFVSAAS
ncbi:Trm112 family protein [Microbulbifer pacificus]|uniref:Trm112 family protein n=1 Tax=Microbulbifer pacificus TaxID=407164 RepID=A0AAU0N075_9GAMM|nr:hypothetical protein [Microbulbifer pacificus]WOX05865.1 hypothetical protein R5R33_01570 [Microbulbifer pacificus]